MKKSSIKWKKINGKAYAAKSRIRGISYFAENRGRRTFLLVTVRTPYGPRNDESYFGNLDEAMDHALDVETAFLTVAVDRWKYHHKIAKHFTPRWLIRRLMGIKEIV